MAGFLVRLSEKKWYRLILTVIIFAFLLRSILDFFPQLLSLGFALPSRDISFLATFVVLTPSLARTIQDLRKENQGKYDPADRRIRQLAKRDGLLSVLFFGASFLLVLSLPYLYSAFEVVPIWITTGLLVILISVGVHLSFRALLAPFGAYPWRWLPRKFRAGGTN